MENRRGFRFGPRANYKHSAWPLIDALAPDFPPDDPDPSAGWAAYIAALAVIENRLYENVPTEYQEKIKRLQKWLEIMLENTLLPPVQRAAAGEALAYLGDPRKGVVSLPPQLTESIKAAYIASFEPGVYIVTNAQFTEFIKANGYNRAKWWSEDGLKWLQNPPDHRGGTVKAPAYSLDSRFNAPNQPVVGVSYYEAEAFCKWLSENSDREYRLPTKEEWRVLAQGESSDEYPWGNEWKTNAANIAKRLYLCHRLSHNLSVRLNLLEGDVRS